MHLSVHEAQIHCLLCPPPYGFHGSSAILGNLLLLKSCPAPYAVVAQASLDSAPPVAVLKRSSSDQSNPAEPPHVATARGYIDKNSILMTLGHVSYQIPPENSLPSQHLAQTLGMSTQEVFVYLLFPWMLILIFQKHLPGPRYPSTGMCQAMESVCVSCSPCEDRIQLW